MSKKAETKPKNKKHPQKKQNKNKKQTKTPKINPNTATLDDLNTELSRISEESRRKPSQRIKNKQKRNELVLLRSGTKNKLKGKIRRKKQKIREEQGDDALPTDLPKTVDMLREEDETMIQGPENDEELKEEINNDEFAEYFKGEKDPQILITTSISHTAALFKFIKEIKDAIPNTFFYYRKKYNLKEIIEQAKEKGFTHVVVVYERLRKPYRLTITHLPEGPTMEFKISNVVYNDQIEHSGRPTSHDPELIFKNFKTKVGFRLNRMLHSMFPLKADFNGRRVVTFHNQRDFIFFRNHRYIFNKEYDKVHLQEVGPRFTLRILSIQKGTFDREFGEYEWYYKDKMGVRRRKFNV